MKRFSKHIKPSQVIGIIVLTCLFRLAIPALIAALGVDTRTGETAANYSLSGSWLHIIGLLLYIYAIVIFAVERHLDLPFWYGRSQSAGSNANGAIIVSIAIALLMLSPIMTAVLVLITIVIQILISTAADNRREALESKFAGRTGTAVGEINGKGLVDLEGEKVKVISKKVIPAGARVKATGVRGSRIVVMPEEPDQAEGSDRGVGPEQSE